jgi:hypothetical protein
MSDELLETIPALAVLIEAIALVWVFARRNVSGVVLINALGAAALILAIAPKLGASLQLADFFSILQLSVLVFALATLTTSLSWLAHRGGQTFAVWTEFSVMVGLSVALASLIFFLRAAGDL